MRKYPSRKDSHYLTVGNFLLDEKKESITMYLYGREIKDLLKEYPGIYIEKETNYKNTELLICTVYKNKIQ